MAAWKIAGTHLQPEKAAYLLKTAYDAQIRMTHPLGCYVYFVHGYFGNNSIFDDMINTIDSTLDKYDGYRLYSYFEDYPSLTASEVHNIQGGISTYAYNFMNRILADNAPGTQIDVVAHSLGGIITREMLRLYRSDLELAGIEIGRVITAGTPHYGTELARYGLAQMAIIALISLFGDNWASPVFYSLHPLGSLITTLNDNPSSYSSGIKWYTLGGNDLGLGLALYVLGVHSWFNDQLVTTLSASLSFAENSTALYCDHTTLVSNREDYPFISAWLGGGFDEDQDGLLDVEERRLYGTNPLSSDSDMDGLSDYEEIILYLTDPLDFDTDGDTIGDGAEVWTYGTNPLAWSTDGDILSDRQEIDWGYDPNDTDDPIDAESLTYSAWQVSGTTGKVRANHYSAMDYVKVYVKYKNSLGYWTAYFYVSIDYTPTYYGDYYVEWSLLQGYIEMQVNVQAYDSADHYLGSNQQYVTLPGGGGGGKPGGDPVPE
ncbi:hypothetical protein EU527_12790 [Candidatus Thorarchaeota archaeon]|nr:MAG: hypothetical protein EU527_12790 [Candidatus Thorarchaeota archaeon]